MPVSGVLNNWRERHYAARDQARVLSFLLDRAGYYESVGYEVPVDHFLQECERDCHVSKSMARRWWMDYEMYGELPIKTVAYIRRVKKRYNWLSEKAKINQAELQQLKEIIYNWPDLFLDEIAIVFGMHTCKFMHHVTLWRYVTNNL